MKKITCLLINLLLVFASLTKGVSYAATEEIKEHLKTLEIGSAFNYRNLTIVPIYAKEIKDKTDYVNLDEAVRKGYITITELEGGRVPQVRITNNSNQYILLICGEILTGGKQDRLVGRDVLIAPKSKNIILPVYCSEQNRWSGTSQEFYSGYTQAEPVLRGMLYGKRAQSSVWDRITGYATELDVKSNTSALQDVYKNDKVVREMHRYTEKLADIPRLEQDAVGVVVGLNSKVMGIDIFANPKFFSSIWPKLLKSYVALAISQESKGETLTQEQAKTILNEVYTVEFSRQKGLDLGEELQANTSGMVCSTLTYRKAVVHFAAFPTDQKTSKGPMDRRISVIE